MNPARRVSALLALAVLVTACGRDTSTAGTPTTNASAARPSSRTAAAGVASTAAAVLPPSIEDARAVALGWVASTRELLKMGPIGRRELLREQVASASADEMTENLDSDLAKLADGLPIPSTELRLVETPLTADVSIDAVTSQARAQVWSVVVFGAKDLGAPRVIFRTSDLLLVVEDGAWRLASFTSSEGPTPIATDALPADWDGFAVAAGWQPAAGGVG